MHENGLRVLDIQSVRPAWTVELSTASSRVETALYPKPHQFEIALPSLVDQSEIEVSVTSIAKTGPIFFDIWFNEYWLMTRGTLKDGIHIGRLRLPPAARSPSLAQVYNNTYQPGNNRTGRHILLGDKQDQSVLAALVKTFEIERPATGALVQNLVGIRECGFSTGSYQVADP